MTRPRPLNRPSSSVLAWAPALCATLLLGVACFPDGLKKKDDDAATGSGGGGGGGGGAGGGGMVDADGDGYTVAQGDCDDADGKVHPLAGDVFGDGVDGDCDGGDYDATMTNSGAYYVLVPEWVGADKAAARCTELGYQRLAEIFSTEEQTTESHLPSAAYLAKYGDDKTYFGGGKRLWIGLRREGSASKWGSGAAASYTAWYPSQPSGDGPCVEGDTADHDKAFPNGGWNDIACSQAMPFVCETRSSPAPIDVLYAAGDAGALAKSLDLGATWTTVSTVGVTGDFNQIAGGNGRLVASTSAGGLITSVDEGATWTPCNGTGTFPALNWTGFKALAYLGGRWFFGGAAEIYTSEDGENWTQRFSSTSMKDGYGKPARFATFARVGDNVVASTTSEGYTYLVRSADGGATWGAPEQMNGTIMPGIGINCAHHWVAGGTKWKAFAGSYCDGIAYNPAKIWTNAQPSASGNWTAVTPSGHFVQDLAYGYDGAGETLLLGGPGLGSCAKAVLLASDGTVLKTSALPEASFEKECPGWIEKVGDTWFARAGSSVARSSDGGATWAFSKPGFLTRALTSTTSSSPLPAKDCTALSFGAGTVPKLESALTYPDAWTIEGWARVPSFPSAGNWGALVGVDAVEACPGMAKHWYVQVQSDGTIDGWIGGKGTASTTQLAAGKWFHFALQYEGGGVGKLYVDGKLARSATDAAGTWPITCKMRLGNSQGSATHYLGADVASLRYSQGARYGKEFAPEAALVSDAATLWQLDFAEGSGKVATDPKSSASWNVTGASWIAEGPGCSGAG